MKKIISLVLVMMLLLTSVFTGISVFAEETAEPDTSSIYVDELGLTIDDSKVPGISYGQKNQHYINGNPEEGRSYDVGAYPITGYKSGNWMEKSLRAKWLPSVALNAGKTGEGDHALRVGVKGNGFGQYPVRFLLRDAEGSYSFNSNKTYTVKFDVKLLYGTISNIYSNLSISYPGTAYPTNYTSDFTEVYKEIDRVRKVYNEDGETTGYTGEDISSEYWTTLTFTTNIDFIVQYFYINFVCDDANGGVVLLDNIRILDENNVNWFVSDKVSVTNTTNEYSYVIPYENVGDFDEKGMTYDDYGLLIDNSLIPGYYLGNTPYIYDTSEENAEAVAKMSATNNDGCIYVTTSGGWVSATLRKKWTPSVAVGAGRSGYEGDNALRFGIPDTAMSTNAIIFKLSSNIFKYGKKFTIQFDIKQIDGNIANIYSGIFRDYPDNARATTVTTFDGEYVDGKSAYTQRIYNSSYETTGYTGENIASDKWTTLTFNTTSGRDAQNFFINVVPADNTGAVVLIDNIRIFNNEDVNIFDESNLVLNSANSYTYDNLGCEFGTFDTKSNIVDNSVDEGVTYIPMDSIDEDVHYRSDSTAAISISDAGEGVKGSYALNVGKGTLNWRGATSGKNLMIPGNAYVVEFKARSTADTVTNLTVGIKPYTTMKGYTERVPELYNVETIYAGVEATETTEAIPETYEYTRKLRNYLTVSAEELASGWKEYRCIVYTVSPKVYNYLTFTVNGTDNTANIQLDDVKIYNADNLSEQKYVAETLPKTVTFDVAYTNYNVDASLEMVKVTKRGVTASEFIKNMNLNTTVVNSAGNANTPVIYNGEIAIAETDAIGTGYILSLDLKAEDATSLYAWTIVVKNDINGDAEFDSRDIVRAKKGAALTEELSSAQLMAAGVAEGNNITITEVAALRKSLMAK